MPDVEGRRLPEESADGVVHRAEDLEGARQVLRGRDLGRLGREDEPVLGTLVGRLEGEDLLVVLAADDATRGEGAAVAEPADLEFEGERGISTAHEVRVEGVGEALGGDGRGGGEERLGDDLAAVDAPDLGE